MHSLDVIVAMNQKAERKEKADRAAVVDRIVNGYPPPDPVAVAKDREKCKADREALMRYQNKTFPEMVVLRVLRTLPAVRTVND